MTDFVNTREEMGEAAALDAVVARTLAEIKEDGVASIGSYALYNNLSLKRVNFPELTDMGSDAMEGCTNLEVVDIGKKCTIATKAFKGNSRLASIILRGTTMSTLSKTDALTGVPIKWGMGGVYVPAALLNTYKAGSNWSVYADNIFPIEDYPRADYSTITDTWEQIFAAETDGTYTGKYHVGDTKTLTMGNKVVYMQVAAIDGDNLADGSGKAKITWIAKHIYDTHVILTPPFNDDKSWANSTMRSYLISDVFTAIPAVVQNNIKEVVKTYYDNNSSSTKTSNDRIWIPSYREVMLGTDREDSGVQYSALFPDKSSRIKYDAASGTAGIWWLRTEHPGISYYEHVLSTGGSGYESVGAAQGVVFGFCT